MAQKALSSHLEQTVFLKESKLHVYPNPGSPLISWIWASINRVDQNGAALLF